MAAVLLTELKKKTLILHGLWHEPILFKLGVMIDTTKHYIFILM